VKGFAELGGEYDIVQWKYRNRRW